MAGNPNQVWGQTRFTVDGVQYQCEGKNTIEVGGPVRSSVQGDNAAGFFSSQVQEAKIEVSILVTAGISLTFLQSIDNATVVHECDTGQLYVVRNAYVADKVSASEGKAKVVFQGPPAEELL